MSYGKHYEFLQSLNQIAEVELIYKTKIKASERPQVKISKDAANL